MENVNNDAIFQSDQACVALAMLLLSCEYAFVLDETILGSFTLDKKQCRGHVIRVELCGFFLKHLISLCNI